MELVNDGPVTILCDSEKVIERTGLVPSAGSIKDACLRRTLSDMLSVKLATNPGVDSTGSHLPCQDSHLQIPSHRSGHHGLEPSATGSKNTSDKSGNARHARKPIRSGRSS
jgi:hypothetical protein